MKKYFILIFSLILSAISLCAYAQVTIGSTEIPMQGALLDLKESGKTKKGLGLPRVWLEDLTILKPAVDPEVPADRQSHVGLMVYNMNDALCKGLFIWEGEYWTLIGPCEQPQLEFRMHKETTLGSGSYTQITPSLEPSIGIASGTTISSASGVDTYWKYDLSEYSSDYPSGRFIFSHMSPDPITIPQNSENNILNLYYNTTSQPIMPVTVEYYVYQRITSSYVLKETVYMQLEIGENIIDHFDPDQLGLGYQIVDIQPAGGQIVQEATPELNILKVYLELKIG